MATCSPAPCRRRSARRTRRSRRTATSAASTGSGSSSPAPTTRSGAPPSPPTPRGRGGRWVSTAGATARLWRRLVAPLGLPAMADDPRFATNVERVKHRRELEAALEEAIAQVDREPPLKGLAEAAAPAPPATTADPAPPPPPTTN